MNKVALEKLIDKLVLDRYSWIEDFDIKVYTFSPSMSGSKKIGYQNYEVIYYILSDKDETTTDDELIKVEELTEVLFKMIGFEPYQHFKGVEFIVNDK